MILNYQNQCFTAFVWIATQAVTKDGTMASGGINRTRLLKRCLGDGNLVTELLELFCRQTPLELEVCRAALRADAGSAVLASVHRLKSAASTVAAEQLCALLEELERRPALGMFEAVEAEFTVCLHDAAAPKI